MDELYNLVRVRICKVKELHNVFLKDEYVKLDETRKAKEDERYRIEKENWILNNIKSFRDYSQGSKL